MVTSICFYFAKEVFGPIQSFKCLHKHTRLPTHALIAVFAGNLNVIVLKVHLALLSRQRSFQINGRNAFFACKPRLSAYKHLSVCSKGPNQAQVVIKFELFVLLKQSSTCPGCMSLYVSIIITHVSSVGHYCFRKTCRKCQSSTFPGQATLTLIILTLQSDHNLKAN